MRLDDYKTSISKRLSVVSNEHPSQLHAWLNEQHCRSLSMPDLRKVREEWDMYQRSNNRIPESKMQIDLLNIQMHTNLKRPQIRLRMGPAQYYSKCSKSSSGDWNEGFVFTVSYHAQLFDTVEFDVYDRPHRHWPKAKRIGKAKLKISTLANKGNVLITFLPVYEYHSKRLLPSEVKCKILETNVVSTTRLNENSGDLNLIGSIQIRVRYSFLSQTATNERIIAKKRLLDLSDDESTTELQALSKLTATTSAQSGWTRSSKRRCSYGRGDLAQQEDVVDELFKHRLSNIMSQNIPNLSEETISSENIPSDQGRHQGIYLGHTHWVHQLISSAKKLPKSTIGQRYGFSQNDTGDNQKFNPKDDGETSSHASLATSVSSKSVKSKLTHGAKKKAQNLISSVSFGDRNFATQWMQDSFEDVALSHPIVDKLIGLVVSKQTQAMVRAIIKTVNSFGQGFRVTGIQFLKAALLIQRYYEALPRPVSQKPIEDGEFIRRASHYFSYALIAYGWRGLCFLGLYGQYVRGMRHRRSNRLAILRFLQLPPEDLLGYEYSLRKGASLQPSYYIAVDRRYKALVLSIRGTWSLYDAITDLICEYIPWKGGLVHSGMLASAQWFYTHIMPQIFRYIHYHNKHLEQLIITGHSLGGGTASLLTMMVADHMEELRGIADNPDFQLHCYNYAPSAVSSPDLGKEYEEYIHSFVCQDDIVGHLSYGSAMKLKELILDTISTYETLGGFRKSFNDSETRKLCFDIITQQRDKLNSKADSIYPSLYVPGKIIYIQRTQEARSSKPSDTLVSHNSVSDYQHKSTQVPTRHSIPGTTKTTYTLHHAAASISDEIKLTTTCIEDHMITSYQNAFEALREQYK